ncbi:hypothetical protein ABF200_002262 [Flavobacterium psychrophilum]
MAFHGRKKGFFAPIKKVEKYKDGVLIFTYEKLLHCATDFGLDDATMSRFLNGKTKSVKWLPLGISLKYKKEYSKETKT